ncbi:hypothetical protein DL95DRAFT_400182 [Leptodontidium sp. 2 PMI_412]|nr:hypothetical protein DL95DRAFT_400182 [Leptodontidium sp. 2 PMI_412]
MYGRWVDSEARKMEARLEKKRKQMERNKQKMEMGRNTHYAEVENQLVQARIYKTETERVAEELHLNQKLEEIEREIAVNNLNDGDRAIRSRAPSPETHPADRAILNRTAPIPEPALVGFRAPCNAATRPETAQLASKTTGESCPKPPPRKIIWKIKFNPTSVSSSTIPPSDPTPTTKKKTDTSQGYIWEEYDHSEVFEEPDDPYDEDYEPPSDE